MERPSSIPEEVWCLLPAFPFEYPGIYGFLPLPRFLLDELAPKQEIALSAGWNTVTYTGERQTAGKAFESIMNYLVIAYHWNADAQDWNQMVTNTMMIPNDVYNIKVSQNCVWRF